MRSILLATATLVVTSLPVAGQPAQRLRTEKAEIIVETVAGGLNHPWGLAFLPDGRMLVTEKPGRLRIVSAEGEISPPIAKTPQPSIQFFGRSTRSQFL